MPDVSHSAHLQLLLDRLNTGQDSARELLIENSLERFRVLARSELSRVGDLRRLDETDDVLQQAMVRLYRALAHIHPPDVRAYVGLAARQIRYALRDLARRASGGDALARPHGPLPPPGGGREPAAREGPSTPMELAEFHESVDRLPAEFREVIDLLVYEGMTQADAAGLLGVSERTLKRRWQEAKLALGNALSGEGEVT